MTDRELLQHVHDLIAVQLGHQVTPIVTPHVTTDSPVSVGTITELDYDAVNRDPVSRSEALNTALRWFKTNFMPHEWMEKYMEWMRWTPMPRGSQGGGGEMPPVGNIAQTAPDGSRTTNLVPPDFVVRSKGWVPL